MTGIGYVDSRSWISAFLFLVTQLPDSRPAVRYIEPACHRLIWSVGVGNMARKGNSEKTRSLPF